MAKNLANRLNLRWWIGLFALAVLGLLLFFVGPLFTPVIPVEVAVVERGNLQVVIEEEGKTRLPDVVTLRMPFSGHLLPIELREGDRVYKDQVLVEIDPRDVQLAYEIAAAEVSRLENLLAENRDVTLEKLLWQLAAHFAGSVEKAELAAAKQVEASRAKAAYAEAFLRRMENLYAQKAATEEERDKAQLQFVEFQTEYATSQLLHAMTAALKTAVDFTPLLVERYIEERSWEEKRLQAELAAAKARLAQAELDRSRLQIRSPVEGVILSRYTSGATFLPAGTPLLEVGNLDELEVEVDLLTTEAVRLRQGMSARISFGTGESFSGNEVSSSLPEAPVVAAKVSRIYPAGFTKISSLGVEEERVKVILRPDPKDLLRLREHYSIGVGFSARVRILIAEKTSVLLIPSPAVTRDPDNRPVVWQVVKGRVYPRPVVLGTRGHYHVEIVEGLQPGDLVVWMPSADLKPAQPVRIERQLTVSPITMPETQSQTQNN